MFGVAGSEHCFAATNLSFFHMVSQRQCRFWLAALCCRYMFASYCTAQFSTSSAARARGFLIFGKQKIVASNNFVPLIHKIFAFPISFQFRRRKKPLDARCKWIMNGFKRHCEEKSKNSAYPLLQTLKN